MAQLTIDESMVGQVILSGIGVINSVTMVTPPNLYGYRENLTFADSITGHERDDFNLDISTSSVSTGSLIHSNVAFQDLMLKSIPKGSSFEIDYSAPPTLASLSPDTVISGDPDFVLSCIGTDLTTNTVINFAGEEEPTTWVSDTEVTTIVKPSLFAPADIPVYLHIGEYKTDVLTFSFTPPGKKSDEEPVEE